MTTPYSDTQLLAAGRAYLAAACSGTATQAVAAMRAVLAAQSAPEAVRFVGYMSPKQQQLIKDADGEAGTYIPMRATPAGNFTLALYAGTHAAQQGAERTLLQQYDIEELPGYRAGYEDGRQRGYIVGKRHAEEAAAAHTQQLATTGGRHG